MNDKPLKILLIEDNPGDVRLIREMLTEAGNDLFELEYADRLITGLRCLAEGDIDVILLDLGLPDSHRFDTFARVHAQAPQVPIILLTALDDEVLAMKVVRQGAQDYLIKGKVDSNLLSRTIRYAIERKRAEETLHREKEKYRILVEESPLGVSIIGMDGHYKYINPKFVQIFGYTLEDIPTGREWFRKAYPDQEYRNQVISAWIKDLKESKRGKSVSRTFIVTCKDGSEKAIHFRPVTMETGEQFVIYEDITERKKAEDALRMKDNAIESSINAIAFADLEENLTYVNNSFLKLWGYSDDKQVLGRPATGFWQMEEKALEVIEALRERGSWIGELVAKKKDGSLFDVQLSASMITDKVGKPICMMGSFVDITERKKAQEKLQRSLKKLRRALGATIQAMALTVEMRDAYTAGHQRRVTDLARAIATEMQLSEHHIDGIRMAGTIHDIGKIGVPAEILNKPIRLTDIEFNLIKIHPLVGYNILKQIKFPWPVAKMILQHHERMNGSGYPHGLSGDVILLQARILGVADVVEAMASRRPYRPALGIDKALEEISQNRSVLYDPEVVDTCLKLFTERGFKFKKDKSSKFIY